MRLYPAPAPAEPRRPAQPPHPAERRCPSTCTASAAATATAATAATSAMASPTVLTFDAEGRAVDFDVWVDDLQLFLQCESRDGVSLFNHTCGVSTAPAATADKQCGGTHSAQRCFRRLTDAWRQQFPEAVEIPRWGELSRAGVAIFDLDFDAILAAMYAMTISDEGDCYRCFPPDPGIGTAALGAGEASALGASASVLSGVGETALSGTSASALSGTASASTSLTFTLDSGASRSFFRDRTTLTPLSRPVAVSLADPSGGPVLSRFSIVLPCPAAPSGILSGLYLPSFSTNLVSGAALQDAGVHQFTPARQRVTHCTEASTGRHLATFTRQPGSSLYTLTTTSPTVPESGRVLSTGQVFAAASRSGPESAPCSCRRLSHETLLWHHRLGHPSLPRLRGMASRLLVSGLPRSLPPLPQGPGPTCVPCVEGRQRAAPHSSSFPPTEAPLQTLHMDVWGPARIRGLGHERYFLLVVDDYSRYTTVFPLRSKGDVTEVFPVLRLHSDRGGEFSSGLLRAFCRARGIRQTFTLPDSPQQNGIAERRIGMVMDVARTSMMHAAAPHFLWPFAVRYAAHQINLHPRVSSPETSPALLWTGKVGDASAFRGPAPSGVSQVDAVEPVEATGDSGAAAGAEPGGAGTGGAEPGGAEPGGLESGGAEPGGAGAWGAEPGGHEPGGAEPGAVEPEGAATEGAPPGGALSRREPLSPQELREWFARRWRRAASAGGSSAAEGAAPTGSGGAGSPGAAGPEGSSGAGPAEGAGAEPTTGGPASAAPGAAGGSGATGGAAGGSGAAGGAAGGPAGAGSPAWGGLGGRRGGHRGLGGRRGPRRDRPGGHHPSRGRGSRPGRGLLGSPGRR
ncbi:unnamed protein product, partial [Closterium sp. NIES-54]